MVRARFVLLVAATLLGGALPARAAAEAQEPNPFRIGQTMIGRAPLGKPLKFYQAAYGSPGVRVRGSGGFDRVIFADSRLEVLFRPGSTPTAVGVITWAARVETARGVGACTLTRRLVATYGLKLRRVALGKKVTAYRLGRLVFVATLDGFVHSVGLLAPGVSISPVLTAPACGSPSVV